MVRMVMVALCLLELVAFTEEVIYVGRNSIVNTKMIGMRKS